MPGPRWLTPQQLEDWMALSRLMALLPAALEGQLQRDCELSYLEYLTLAVLSEQPRRQMAMSELAALANAEASRLSHLVGRLERRGFLRREPSPCDRRRINAVLTDAGLAYLRSAAPGHVEQVRRLVVDALGDEALRAVGDAAREVLARIDADGPVRGC